MSQTQISVKETSFCQKNKFLSLKQVSLTQASVCLKISVCLKKKFLSEREVSVDKIVYICVYQNKKISTNFVTNSESKNLRTLVETFK